MIKREERKDVEGGYTYGLAVEGYGLREVMGTFGVHGTRCTSNHVMEVKDVRLGIERYYDLCTRFWELRLHAMLLSTRFEVVWRLTQWTSIAVTCSCWGM